MLESPFGKLILTADAGGEHLVGLSAKKDKYPVVPKGAAVTEKADLPVFITIEHWLNEYFTGKRPDTSGLPLLPSGSAFRRDVWQMLLQIPYGEVTTYGKIAGKIAHARGIDKMASQAVGGAVGHNPISIIIPCHRVVGKDGNLTGYGGGIDMKIRLLEHEGLDTSRFFIPKRGTAL
jgi:methylated-DNA-[protein]-cysteine S-methyltransferase